MTDPHPSNAAAAAAVWANLTAELALVASQVGGSGDTATAEGICDEVRYAASRLGHYRGATDAQARMLVVHAYRAAASGLFLHGDPDAAHYADLCAQVESDRTGPVR